MSNVTSELAPLHLTLPGEVSPFAVQKVTLTKQEYIELRCQAHSWKTQHARARAREEALKQECAALRYQLHNWQAKHAIACKQELTLKALQHELAMALVRENGLQEALQHKEAVIRDLQQRLFGKKTEKGACNPETNPNIPVPKSTRPRGQQRGSKGHGRTAQPNLPIIEERILLHDNACPRCGQQYSRLKDEESSVFEIEIRAHTRRIKREKVVKNCNCPGPMIITAPPPLKLFSKSPYGLSIWEQVLINKFLYAQPINRILNDLAHLGLKIAPGTIAGGLQKCLPLFAPVYQGFHERQMSEQKFHNDETRWEVYQQVEGKVGHRWYLWVTRSVSVVYYCMDPTRSAAVPIQHFSGLLSKSVIVICDRYGAYKKLARLNLAIIIAFCWAHVRRDFLELSRNHESLKDWGLDWVEDISKLFHLNKERLTVWNHTVPLAEQTSIFQEKQNTLWMALEAMKSRCAQLLDADQKSQHEKKSDCLKPPQRKVLASLKNHWEGLTVFYEHPEVEMDNNLAEQSMRTAVLGRNGYYGSGSIWSAELAGMMFSLFQTLLLWKLNPRTWLRLYLDACLQNGGQPPKDLKSFFPWSMNAERLQQLSKPPP